MPGLAERMLAAAVAAGRATPSPAADTWTATPPLSGPPSTAEAEDDNTSWVDDDQPLNPSQNLVTPPQSADQLQPSDRPEMPAQPSEVSMRQTPSRPASAGPLQPRTEGVSALGDIKATVAAAAAQHSSEGGCGVEVMREERKAVEALMRRSHSPAPAEQSSSAGLAGWGECLESETVITVAASGPGCRGGALQHRLYVHTTPGSMRLATVVVPED